MAFAINVMLMETAQPARPNAFDAAAYAARGRIGALMQAAKYGPGAFSEPGRRKAASKLNERLLAEIDLASPGLLEPERMRRLKYARSAHFRRLALKSAKTRQRRKTA